MSFEWIVIGVYLAMGSIYDRKSMLLPSLFLWMGGLSGAACGIYRILCEETIWEQWIIACFPGILWMITAYFTKEQIGYGDGVVLLVLGSLSDIQAVLRLLMLGLGTGCVYGIYLLVTKRGNRHTAFPFVPMLFLAYLVVTGGKLLL